MLARTCGLSLTLGEEGDAMVFSAR